MDDSTFIFKKWENRLPYYALMQLEEEKICILENTWGAARSKGIRFALCSTFVGGWVSVVKEAGKHSLRYGGRKALGCVTTVVCAYFGTASIVLITKSTKIIKGAKICHSVCSGGLDMAELCASAPIAGLEIAIFGRPVVMEGQGFDLFSKNPDPLKEMHSIFKK